MKTILAATVVFLLACTPASSQQNSGTSPASKQDVEQLLTVTGARERIQQLWAQMGDQIAMTAAESYRMKHPDATPMQLHKVAQIASKSFQSSLSVVSVDELIDVIIPVYQKHLTHADMQGILAFYNSPPGKKYLKEQPAMQAESMQALQPVIRKHMPAMQAAADKAVQETLNPSSRSNSTANHQSK